MDENIKLTGHIKMQIYGPDGKLKHEYERDNLVVTVGKTYLATWLAAASQAGKFMSYIALGTGSTAPASGDTTLTTEFAGGGYSRQVGTLTSSSNVWTNTATFGPGNGTGVVAEAGLFSAVTTGTMFAHVLAGPYTKGAGDTLTFAWSVTFN